MTGSLVFDRRILLGADGPEIRYSYRRAFESRLNPRSYDPRLGGRHGLCLFFPLGRLFSRRSAGKAESESASAIQHPACRKYRTFPVWPHPCRGMAAMPRNWHEGRSLIHWQSRPVQARIDKVRRRLLYSMEQTAVEKGTGKRGQRKRQGSTVDSGSKGPFSRPAGPPFPLSCVTAVV